MAITEEQKALALKYAQENIHSGLNCSESVLNALLRAKIADFPPEVTALASGLNGGAGSAGYTCGALAGAMIALGAVYGRRDPVSTRAKVYQTPGAPLNPEDDYRYYFMRRFNACVDDFKKRMGTVTCQDVIDGNGGYYNKARQQKCEQMIRCGVEVALKYIGMEQKEADALPYGENLFGWK